MAKHVLLALGNPVPIRNLSLRCCIWGQMQLLVQVTACMFFSITCLWHEAAWADTTVSTLHRLADAAERKDWDRVKRELANEKLSAEEVNAQQADGTTALHWAVWHDELAITKLLLDAHADPERSNRYDVRPLSLACANGNAKMVRALLSAGARANTQMAGGESALMTAARTGSLAIVELLIEQGADVNAKELKGQTALMWAAAEGYADVVEKLIDAGADFRSPLSTGFTPLLFAAREGHIAVAKRLIARGADVNAATEREKASGKLPRNGTSPLILSVENGHFELAIELVHAGADPNDLRSGHSALHTLTWVRKPNRGDGDDGDPAPAGSGRMTSLQFVRELVNCGADVNLRLTKGSSGRGQLNRAGATPFLMAASTDDLPYMKLLVELGADPTIPNVDNCTPLMAAAGIGVLAPGEEAGLPDEALDVVKYLLELGADVNAVDNNGETAMHGAAYKSLPHMVKLLAERGADINLWNRKNKYGWTPLMIAEGQRPGNFKPNEETQAALKVLIK